MAELPRELPREPPTGEPVTFVVERHDIGEIPSIVYDRLPGRLTARESKLLAYSLHLDIQTNSEELLGMPLAELYRRYLKGLLPGIRKK